MISRLRHKIQKIFFAGLLVSVPTMLTFFLLKFLVNYIDKVSAPLVRRFLHTNIPGLGFVVTMLIVLSVGFLGTNIIGKQLVVWGDRLLSKIPLVRSIYTSAKQIMETVAFATEKPFQQVVLVPYPRQGVYAIGMVTSKVSDAVIPSLSEDSASDVVQETPNPEEVMSVFVPSTPNFTSGLLIMFPRRDIIPLSMSIEEGFKYLMSGGILVPETEPDEQRLEEWDLFLY